MTEWLTATEAAPTHVPVVAGRSRGGNHGATTPDAAQ